MASGPIWRSTELWEISRSCHRAAVFQCRHDHAADQPGLAGQVLAQHRVALVGHGRGAFLALGEIFLGFADFGALQVADFDRQPLDGAGDDAENREIHGVAVARDDLGRDRLRRQAELCRDMGLDPRIDGREAADRAGDGAGRDLRPRRLQPRPAAGELGIMAGQLDAEGGGLGMDAVAAPHR